MKILIAIPLVLALAACDSPERKISPAMIATAKHACENFGGVVSFRRLDEEVSYDKAGNRIKTWFIDVTCYQDSVVVKIAVGTDPDVIFSSTQPTK